jgi:hypothetical protein
VTVCYDGERAGNTLDRHECMTLSCPLSRVVRRASSHLGSSSCSLFRLRPPRGSKARPIHVYMYYRQNPLLEAFVCALEASSTMYLAPGISTRHTYSDSQSTGSTSCEINLSRHVPTRSTGRYEKQPRGANHKFPPRSRSNTKSSCFVKIGSSFMHRRTHRPIVICIVRRLPLSFAVQPFRCLS